MGYLNTGILLTVQTWALPLEGWPRIVQQGVHLVPGEEARNLTGCDQLVDVLQEALLLDISIPAAT